MLDTDANEEGEGALPPHTVDNEDLSSIWKLIEGTDNIIQYIFKKIEEDATVH